MQGAFPAPPRRVEALAYIVDRIQRSSISPTYDEIGLMMSPRVGKTRARRFVDELVDDGLLDRTPGSHRGIGIRDLARCRQMIDEALGQAGWWHAAPLSFTLVAPCTNVHLPLIPPFEHIPDVD